MDNFVTNTSYINKDFNSIYVELLDLVKQLSPDWDPSQSNESDPGVLLLKADALIGDKNNYNIDKNILELFPETVTQEYNARNIYRQMGYAAPWIKSATGNVLMRWAKDTFETDEVVIPKYTMLTDLETSVVYTTTSDAAFTEDEQIITVPVIEGNVETLTVNNVATITMESIDVNKRLYLHDYMVAENGVYVTSVTSGAQWEQVKNVLLEPEGSLVYEYCVDVRNSLVYLQFNDDIDNLIGDGLNIRYVVSRGAKGNISTGTLDRFYSQVSLDYNGETLVVDDSVIQVANNTDITNGVDIPTLGELYKLYKKFVGTFDTFVTARDYANALYNSGLVSNAVVSDRLTDIQSSYTVITNDEVNTFDTYVSRKVTGTRLVPLDPADATTSDGDNFTVNEGVIYRVNGGSYVISYGENVVTSLESAEFFMFEDELTDTMSAFDLKLYLFKSGGDVSTVQLYEDTFSLLRQDSSSYEQVENSLEDSKCVQHNFAEYLPEVPVMFKNKYPIEIRIITQKAVTDKEKLSIKKNILSTIRKVCNSRNVEFGVRPDYEVLYDEIQNCDSLIKTVMISDFKFTTYAVYWDANTKEFKEIPVSNNSTPLCIKVSDLDSARALFEEKSASSPELYKNAYYFYQSVGGTKIAKYSVTSNNVEEYSSVLDDIRCTTIAKSILAGKTPLFYFDSNFKTGIEQQYIDSRATDKVFSYLSVNPFVDVEREFSPTEIVIPELQKHEDTYTFGSKITIPSSRSNNNTNNDSQGQYTLKENESIRCFGPSLINGNIYSNYTKFQLILNNPTASFQTWDYNNPNSVVSGSVYLVDGTNNAGNDGLAKLICGCFPLVFDYTTLRYKTINQSYVENETLYALIKFYINHVSVEGEINNNSVNINCNGDKYFTLSNFNKDTYLPTTCDSGGIPQYQFDYSIDSMSYDYTSDLKNDITVPVYTCLLNGAKDDNGVSQFIDPDGTTIRNINGQNVTVFTSYAPTFYPAGRTTFGLRCILKDTAYVIEQDTDYQLKEGEEIVFFWRGEGDTAPYKYNYFKGTNSVTSPIFRPNFLLRATSRAFATINTNDLQENVTGNISYSSLSNSRFQLIRDLYGDNDLAASNTITQRKLNQFDLKDSEYVYFITNYKVKDQNNKEFFVLPFTTYNPYANRLEYILRSDEYLFRFSKSKELIEALGPGTAIFLPLKGNTLAATTDTGATVDIFLSVAVEAEDAFNAATPSMSQEFKRKLVKVSDLFYVSLNTNSGDVSVAGVSLREQTIYNFVEGDTITIDRGNERLKFIISTDKASLLPEGWNFSYILSTSNDLTTLSPIALNDKTTWVMYATLNLQADSSNPQKILPIVDSSTEDDDKRKSIQQVLWKNNNGWNFVNSNVVEQQQKNPYCIQSNMTLQKVGGIVDVQYVDLLGELKSPTLYAYSVVDYAEYGDFIVRDNTVSLDFSLPTQTGNSEGVWHEIQTSGVDACTTDRIKTIPESSYMLTVENPSQIPYNLYVTEQTQVSDLSAAVLLHPVNMSQNSSEANVFDYYRLPSPNNLLKEDNLTTAPDGSRNTVWNWNSVSGAAFDSENSSVKLHNNAAAMGGGIPSTRVAAVLSTIPVTSFLQTGKLYELEFDCLLDSLNVSQGFLQVQVYGTTATQEPISYNVSVMQNNVWSTKTLSFYLPENTSSNTLISIRLIKYENYPSEANADQPSSLTAYIRNFRIYQTSNNDFTLTFTRDTDADYTEYSTPVLRLSRFVKLNEGTDTFNLYEQYPNINFETVLEKVQQLDYQGKFKYDYVVPTDDIVKNPLSPESFFDTNHIFNSYVLPEAYAKLSESDVDSFASTITILNNR